VNAKKNRRKGQTMVEYIIIVVLVAITVMGFVIYFRDAIAEWFTGATEALSEESGSEARARQEEIKGQNTGKHLDSLD
jgi:Flp pilus assembly pilin Flp